MDNGNTQNNGFVPNVDSTVNQILSVMPLIAYLRSKIRIILSVTLLCGLAGLVISFIIKPKYTATCTFVLEESDKGGLLSQYAGLASLANMGLDNSGGIFKGDNIIELYKSELMVKKTLLTRATINGKSMLLIDRYTSFNNLIKKWADNYGLKNISFENYKPGLNLTQDSLFNNLPEIFNEKSLLVNKPDKKLNIIQVSFTSKDEYFAKEFTDKLVENVNNFYIQTKTKRSSENVGILQHQADSVKAVLNSSINGVSYAIEAAPLANPLLTSQRSAPQRKQVDVQTNTAIYTAIIQNLELAKMSLLQAKPLIQVIDEPAYPLKKSRVSKFMGMMIGFILGFCFISFFFAVKKLASIVSITATS